MNRFAIFDQAQADFEAMIGPNAESLGMGLGDRACVALAAAIGAPTATTKSQGTKLEASAEIMKVR